MTKSIRSLFKNCASFVAVCFAALIITLTCYTPSAKADVIYHAFDECFASIKAELPKIKDAGYNYIQVSPPNTTASRLDNACTSDEYWYIQYQPLDYVLEGNLGTEQDLKDLINEAHKSGIKVIAETHAKEVNDVLDKFAVLFLFALGRADAKGLQEQIALDV